MEYKKIQKDEYNIHLIESSRFKNIIIEVSFAKKFNKEDMVLDRLLKSNMIYSTKKYNTKSKLAIKSEDLYGAYVGAGCSITGNLQFIDFNIEFLNPKYTSSEYMEESIAFLMECIFNPNVKNNEFNKEYFEIIKKEAINETENISINPRTFSSINYHKLMYKGTPTEHSIYASKEELNKVTPKDIYNHYKKLFDGNYKIDIMIHGEDINKIVPIIEKHFKNIKSNKEKLDIYIKPKHFKNLIEKEDIMPFSQSKLYMGYKIKDYTNEDFYALRVYNIILGTMNNSILFDTVREKNSLCYNISSFINKYNPSITIYSGINKENTDKTINLIKECVLKMSDKKTIDKLLVTARKNINTYINSYYDDIIGQISDVYFKEFTNSEDIETYREKLLSITSTDIINLNKKIYLSTIYVMKGDN